MRLNWLAYRFIKVDGYGRLGLGFVQALLRAGHEVHPALTEALDAPAWFQLASGLDFYLPTLQMMPPHEMRPLPGRSIGFSMHESTALPKGWAEHINAKCQYLIVPSPWLIPVFEEAGVEVPIQVVPGGIDPDECPVMPRHQHRPFTIGCLGDRGWRKGFDLVQTAFYKVFDYRNKDVRLIIKARPGSLPDLSASYNRDARLTVWRTDVERVADIYAQFDAFAFPTRCEGLGMPPREAAACGVPTLATRWSGTADDVDHWAIPLDHYKLIDSRMENCGGQWAEPNLDELCDKLLWLYEHQDEAKARAIKGAQWLRANRTYAHAAQSLTRTLHGWLGGPPPAREPDLPAWGERVPALLRPAPNGHKAEVILE